jgi:hypothetical protein
MSSLKVKTSYPNSQLTVTCPLLLYFFSFIKNPLLNHTYLVNENWTYSYIISNGVKAWHGGNSDIYKEKIRYYPISNIINVLSSRGVATVRHFRHNCSPNICLLMKNDKQRITYFDYVCFMFIVLMTSFHKLKDKHLQWVLWH